MRLPIASASESLAEEYRRRLQRWFLGVGLFAEDGTNFRLQVRVSHIGLLQLATPSRRRRGAKQLFFGQAPPQKVLDALIDVVKAPSGRRALEATHGRNTISVLIALEILSSSCVLEIAASSLGDLEKTLMEKAGLQTTIQYVTSLRKDNPKLSTQQIGEFVAKGVRLYRLVQLLS